MTRAAAGFLHYLDRYLAENPTQQKKLKEIFRQHCGRELHKADLWKHTKRQSQPNLSTTLVYQIFLHQAKELTYAKEPGDLFNYKHRAWLKVKK